MPHGTLLKTLDEEAVVARATAAMARVPEDAYRAAMRCLVTFDRREGAPPFTIVPPWANDGTIGF